MTSETDSDSEQDQSPSCPECGSGKVWKDGLRYLKDGDTVQRWLCRECAYRFSDPSRKRESRRSHQSSRDQNFLGLPLKVDDALPSVCQVGALSRKRAINLVEVETRQEKAQREGTSDADVKGKIVEYIWFLKKQGYAKSTVKTEAKHIKGLVKKGADLFDPDSVKTIIAQRDDWSEGYKANIVNSYNKFAEMVGLEWDPPNYEIVKSLPFIPLEKEIDALIAGCGKKVAASLQLMKETAMRIGEAWKLRWTDVDEKRCTIRCRAEKHGNPRMFKVSKKLIDMLNALPKDDEKVFGGTNLNGHRWNFNQQRKRLAKKLQNPRLQQIHFHTFRHWKATMEYNKTKDILHVKQMLGHKKLDSTLVYTQLVNFESNEYHVRTAETVEEAKELAEAGFDYFTEMDDVQIFRKRK